MTVAHVLFHIEEPVGSGHLWEVSLDTDGTTPDKALDTIIGSFTFFE